jgi:hypothetical protein
MCPRCGRSDAQRQPELTTCVRAVGADRDGSRVEPDGTPLVLCESGSPHRYLAADRHRRGLQDQGGGALLRAARRRRTCGRRRGRGCCDDGQEQGRYEQHDWNRGEPIGKSAAFAWLRRLVDDPIATIGNGDFAHVRTPPVTGEANEETRTRRSRRTRTRRRPGSDTYANSATPLPAGAGRWLCDPVSRRVCLFGWLPGG